MTQLPKRLSCQGESRPAVTLFVLAVAGAIILGAAVLHSRSGPRVNQSSATEAAPPVDQAKSSELASPPFVDRESDLSARSGRPTPAASNPVNAGPASSLLADEAMNRLAAFDPAKPLTAEQSAALKRDLQQLVVEGSGAVPAIHTFFKKDQDFSFDDSTSKEIGAHTLRSALIDTLRQIGTPEATSASHEILSGTANPLEVAQLTRNLEEKAPGQFRQEELAAARSSLELAASGQLKGQDISPLFEVFHAYGDATAVAQMKEISERGKWLNYLPYVMAEMPEGAGVAALTELFNNPSVVAKDQQSAIPRSLAIAAVTSPNALNSLTERARQGQISDATWSRIASALAGDSYRPYQPRILTDPPQQDALSAEAIGQRLAVIDQLALATSNQSGRDALMQARARLTAAGMAK